MIKIRTTGYRSRSLFADVSLGIFDGLDNALWCYAFATVIFAGALAQFLPRFRVIRQALELDRFQFGSRDIAVETTLPVLRELCNPRSLADCRFWLKLLMELLWASCRPGARVPRLVFCLAGPDVWPPNNCDR